MDAGPAPGRSLEPPGPRRPAPRSPPAPHTPTAPPQRRSPISVASPRHADRTTASRSGTTRPRAPQRPPAKHQHASRPKTPEPAQHAPAPDPHEHHPHTTPPSIRCCVHRMNPRWGVVPNPDTLLDSLERFAVALTSGYGIGDVLHNLSEETVEALNLTGAGVTLVHDGQQRFVTAALEAIANLERVQETWQKGPCIDAVASAGPVVVPDIGAQDASERWPDYTIAAKTAGIQAVAGIPMLADDA